MSEPNPTSGERRIAAIMFTIIAVLSLAVPARTCPGRATGWTGFTFRHVASMAGINQCLTVDANLNVYRIESTSSWYRYITCINTAGQKWKTPLPDSWHGVDTLVSDGSVVIAYSSRFYQGMFALSATTGKFAWAMTSASGTRRVYEYETIRAALKLNTGRAYLLEPAGVTVLEARTGKPIWRHELRGNGWSIDSYSPPVVAGDKIYFTFDDGTSPHEGALNLYCLDAATGRTTWKRPAGVPSCSTFNEPPAQPLPEPCVHGDRLYTIQIDSAGPSTYLVCLSARTGERFWQTKVPRLESAQVSCGSVLLVGPKLVSYEYLVYDCSSGRFLRSIKSDGPMSRVGEQTSISVASDRQRWIATLWDLTNGKVLGSKHGPKLEGELVYAELLRFQGTTFIHSLSKPGRGRETRVYAISAK